MDIITGLWLSIKVWSKYQKSLTISLLFGALGLVVDFNIWEYKITLLKIQNRK
jgi:hypothetical protein